MRSTFCFKTENGNYYLFDKKARIYSSISKEQFQVFQSLEGHTGTHSPEPEALDDHYVKKYHWLKENGFFMDMESKNRFHGELKVEDLKYHLANLKQLVFEVTDKCNLNCTYCAYGHLYTNYDTRLNRDLSFEEGKEVIDYILSYDKSEFNNLSGIPLTVSFYGGEPLMNFAFVKKMVEYLDSMESKKEFIFSMTTNALLLNKYMDFLVKHKFRLLISLDGNEKGNSYRVFHNKKPAYLNIRKNIDLLREKYPDYFENSVNFNSVLHDHNDVVSIMKFFKKNYNKIPRISPLNDSGIAEEATGDFNRMMKTINEKELSQKADYQDIRKELFLNLPSFASVSTFLMENTNAFYNSVNEIFLRDTDNKIFPTGTCIPFSKKLFVTANKKLMFCERIGHEFFAGTIEDIESQLEKIASDFNQYMSKLRKQCQNCHINDSCSLCMYFIEDLQSNPKCNQFISEKKYIEYLERVFSYLENNPSDIEEIRHKVIID